MKTLKHLFKWNSYFQEGTRVSNQFVNNPFTNAQLSSVYLQRILFEIINSLENTLKIRKFIKCNPLKWKKNDQFDVTTSKPVILPTLGQKGYLELSLSWKSNYEDFQPKRKCPEPKYAYNVYQNISGSHKVSFIPMIKLLHANKLTFLSFHRTVHDSRCNLPSTFKGSCNMENKKIVFENSRRMPSSCPATPKTIIEKCSVTAYGVPVPKKRCLPACTKTGCPPPMCPYYKSAK